LKHSYVLFHKISCLHTFSGIAECSGRRVEEKHLSSDQRASGPSAMLVEVSTASSRIVWLGLEKKWTAKLKRLLIGARPVTKVSLKNSEILPAFVECHTHLLYAGDRKSEFEQRNRGDSYLQIAEAGGGIRSTVRATKSISDVELLKQVVLRLKEFARQGVATVEIKTGYAATVSEELRHLRLLVKLRDMARKRVDLPRVVVTCLAAHSIPAGETESRWLAKIESEIFPFLRKEGIRLDAFVERGAFSISRAREFFEKGKSIGLDLTIHADQLTRTGASHLGSELGAKSVDHVIEANSDDIQKLGVSDTVAVLLPAADLYTRLPYPKARAMIAAGVRVALATDHNPGSSPGLDLALVGVLARTAMQMTLPEVLSAYTYNAASALGLEKAHGHLSVGAEADFICLRPGATLTDLFYEIGPRRSHAAVKSVWRSGKPIYS
jgi:imidazolonepropionase